MKSKFWTAVSLVIGTIIGAGVLGIPKALSVPGLLPGLFTFFLVWIASTFMLLYTGEVVLRTKETKQFTGLARKYLGKFGEVLMFLSVFIGMSGALIAYVVGVGSTLTALFGGSYFINMLLFFVPASIAIYFDLKFIGKVEFWLAALLVGVLLFISFSEIPKVNPANYSYADFSKTFYPYGVLLFAFLGYSIVPEVEMVLGKEKKKMKKVLLSAALLTGFIYLFFSIVMLGVYNSNIEDVATNSLGGLSKVLGSIVAILAMTTGYLALGTALRDNYVLDLKIPKKLAWLMTIIVPISVVWFVSPSFLQALSITGAYAGSLTGVLIAAMTYFARKEGNDKPYFVVPGGTLVIILVAFAFILGAVYQTLALLG